jgi:hypothetical protein
MLEALYVVEFGDLPEAGFRNGGVAVLETSRVFGGDSGYYYLGTYTVKDGDISASVQIVKHNPSWSNAFGDAATTFNVTIQGRIADDTISGFMTRVDKPTHRLPVKLTKKALLP